MRAIFGPPTSTKGALAYGGISLLLLFVAPITILSWSEERLYRPYINPHVYHNPTSVIVKPLALILMVYAVYALRPTVQNIKPLAQSAWLPAAAIILATISKPNYTMCLLPALLIVAIWRRLRGRPMNEYVLIAGFLLPGVATLGWQYFLSKGSNQAGGSILFDPMHVASIRLSGLQPEALWLPGALLLSCLFPLCVTLIYRKQAANSVWLKLSWLVFIIGLGFYYLLAEGGWRMTHGNFVWGAQTALLVLFAVALAFFVAQHPALLMLKRPPLTRGFVICSVVLVLHLISGVIYYLNYAAFDRAWYY
ncbi:MAG: hypothetical protein H7175_10855 [Burkholderiales bacterium]|nr:hypothetical protein [Anaerolineae bacterium]